MRIFSIMNNLMRRHTGFVLLSTFMGLLTILSSIGMISDSSILISRAALQPEVLDLMVLIVAVRFFGISRGIFRYLERLLSHDATFKILSSLRRWFYKSFNESYSGNNKQFKTGDIYTKIVNDVDSLKEFYLRGIYPLIIAILTGIFTVMFIFCFSRLLSVVYSLIYVICGFMLPVILFSFNSRLMKKESELKREINLLLIDAFNGCLEIEIYSLKEEYISNYKQLSKELSIVQKKKNFINILGESLHSLFAGIMIVLVLIITIPLIESGNLQGIYFAMLPLAIMASFEALIPMPGILYKFSEAYSSGKNILSILESTKAEDEVKKKSIESFDISVESISVKKMDNDELIIKDVSFKLPYGKKLAIVGASGSGKSTILKALMGFVKFHQGEIKIGDNLYSQLKIEAIRKLFAYVEQNPYVFNTSIKENLLIANPQADEEKLLKAMERTKITYLANGQSLGLNSTIGQYGSKVSGGEKQRLAIARAMLKESKIVLLDEPTAGLDVNTEKQIIASIHEVIKEKSCIWVTHRLVDMNRMDEILVVHKGRVVERGTHKELIDKRGKYFKLWNIQQQYLN